MRGRVADLGIQTAHHSGERERLGAIGDYEVVRFECALDVVEGLELAIRAGAAHDNPGLRYPVEIERMQRLSELDHHVVGHIDHVVERAHPAQFKAPPDQYGRRSDLDLRHRQRRIART